MGQDPKGRFDCWADEDGERQCSDAHRAAQGEAGDNCDCLEGSANEADAGSALLGPPEGGPGLPGSDVPPPQPDAVRPIASTQKAAALPVATRTSLPARTYGRFNVKVPAGIRRGGVMV